MDPILELELGLKLGTSSRTTELELRLILGTGSRTNWEPVLEQIPGSTSVWIGTETGTDDF